MKRQPPLDETKDLDYAYAAARTPELLAAA
jgi:hypothetical protein